jgi:hypothetical protein
MEQIEQEVGVTQPKRHCSRGQGEERRIRHHGPVSGLLENCAHSAGTLSEHLSDIDLDDRTGRRQAARVSQIHWAFENRAARSTLL